jgi:hypothetical protein
LAQNDPFPITAKVVSSDTESVPSGGSTSTTTAMPGTIWQHPQQNTRLHYRDEIIVTAEIEKRTYRLASPQLLDPGEYPASIVKRTVCPLLNDKNGKPKTLKLRVVSVAAKQ